MSVISAKVCCWDFEEIRQVGLQTDRFQPQSLTFALACLWRPPENHLISQG